MNLLQVSSSFIPTIFDSRMRSICDERSTLKKKINLSK